MVLEIRKEEQPTSGWSKVAYEVIYKEAGIRQRDSFYRWILRLVRPRPGRRLLDVACGEGSLPRLAALVGLEAHGLDLSEVAILTATREAPAALLVADGERLPYADASFDYVTSIGSLEHYLHPPQGVREMARVLAPDGLALVLLPNTFSLLHNVWAAFRTGWPMDDGQPIQRYATRCQWQALLEEGGLVVERTVKYEREWPTSLADLRWYLGHPKTLIRLLLTPLIPLNLASCFVYLCRKAEGGRAIRLLT
jgi:SAM-dependent methyltransferase